MSITKANPGVPATPQCPHCKERSIYERTIDIERPWDAYQAYCAICGVSGPIRDTFEESLQDLRLISSEGRLDKEDLEKIQRLILSFGSWTYEKDGRRWVPEYPELLSKLDKVLAETLGGSRG